MYVDETGINKYLTREYGRARRGEKVLGKVYGQRFERTNIVAAQVGKEIIAPSQYKGTTTSEFFEKWFKTQLLPELSEGSVIVMDNATFHRKNRLNEIAVEHKVKIIFLPPYSPELNPI